MSHIVTIYIDNGEPNNFGGTKDYIRESSINRLNWEGACLNDEHCEYANPSICEMSSINTQYQFAITTTTWFIDIDPPRTYPFKVLFTTNFITTTVRWIIDPMPFTTLSVIETTFINPSPKISIYVDDFKTSHDIVLFTINFITTTTRLFYATYTPISN